MKTAELIGLQLDYWVAKAEGMALPYVYMPSRNWLDGGPIIEREHIGMQFGHGKWWSDIKSTVAEMPGRWGYVDESYLVAAMRAYVASKYGENVPDEKGNQ